jgi:NADH-quinone oxidoreductase subunit C
MEPMEIADRLRSQFPDEILEIYRFQGQTAVKTKRGRIIDMLRWLRDADEIRMNHLRALCGVDNSRRRGLQLERFEVVYNLYSIPLRHALRLRAEIPGDDPRIDSVTSLWKGADWLERETFDLFGICFDGHPDLRRILLPDDWQGHPLRKEYPLRGGKEWAGIVALKARVKELDAFSFQPDAMPADGKEGSGQVLPEGKP